jgi:hypothetical protein
MALDLRHLALLALIPGCIDYGVYREMIRDSFTQTGRTGGVDVLWVVDDSPTMLEEQALVTAQAAAFSTLFGKLAVDFRVAAVSTDMDLASAGLPVGPVLSDETPGLDAAFAALLDLGTDGSRTEQGFAAARSAADPDVAGDTFARATADLELVFLSDEDDQSGLAAGEVLQALMAQRPGVEVVANAVVGDAPNGCFSPLAAADPGLAYLELQELTVGQRESICDADYAAVLQRLALGVLDLTDRFQLSHVPSPTTLEVEVDGAKLHPRDHDGWRYDPGDNSVVFDGYAVPPPGAGITVWREDHAGARGARVVSAIAEATTGGAASRPGRRAS